MNEEIDEYEFFHQDFTTASEWEVFIARLEEILNDWKLSRCESSVSVNTTVGDKWVDDFEEISLYGFTYTISHHRLESKDLQEVSAHDDVPLLEVMWKASMKFIDENSNNSTLFPVATWFGLNHYVMLTPAVPLCDENKIKLIMSSINIACTNIECSVPVYVKIREHWQHSYLGVYEDNTHRINFDTIHLKRIPNHCYHLSGLLNLFKGKISSPNPLESIQLSAKFSYNLKDFETFAFKRPIYNDILNNDFDLTQWLELPFGAIQNPIRMAYLNVIWPRFNEDAVIDSPTYSDFDPLMAPVWTVFIDMEDKIVCSMMEHITKCLDYLDNDNLLMETIGLSKSLGLINPLNKITEAPISFSKLVKATMSSTAPSRDFKGPLSDDILMPLLYYIFPDSVEHSTHQYQDSLQIENKQEDDEMKACHSIKTGPRGGLVWRLGTIAARLLNVGGLPVFAHFWYEFTQELQYRWDNCILVPGVAEGPPSPRTCLLHQKLQLLNCCVKRAAGASGPRSRATSISEEDDEFFDCTEDTADDQDNDGERSSLASCDRPVGRLCRLADANLANGEPLYVPLTQEPAPKTEDQLEEDAELMLRLGDGVRATELRARMMSASLLSDMESFKAANPGAEFRDFVRWYSPRDWEEDEFGGRLSERMQMPGNPWETAWDAARPVPAARQRLLFDERREAERTLHFLRSRSVAQTVELVLPAVFRSAQATLVAAGARGTTGTVPPPGCERRRQWELAARELSEAERDLSRRSCPAAAMRPNETLDAAERARLSPALSSQPSRREFMLRARDGPVPQLMRAVLASDVKIIGAFTESIVF